MGNAGALGRPVACQGFNGPGGNTADRGRPLGVFGNAVAVTQHIRFELIESIAVGVHIGLIENALGNPGKGNGQMQGRIRVR